ncbi:MAG: hypothetical protein SFY70_12875 [Bacteroidia bacterium]|nr:hypothetical protein [Bacteroidia bacterium]
MVRFLRRSTRFGLWVVLLVPHLATAQQAAATPPAALYLSLKNLQFTDAYYKPIAAWLQRNDTLNLRYEDIRLAFAIKLGTYWVHSLDSQALAPGSVFVNGDPEVGQQFVRAYQEHELNAAALAGALPPGVRTLLVVNELKFHGQKETVVFSYSNKLVTDKRYVRQAILRYQVIRLSADGRTVEQARTGVLRFHETSSPNQTRFYRSGPNTPPAQQLLDRVLNTWLSEVLG